MIREPDTLFLRRIFALDAAASGATGLLMTFGSQWLQRHLGLDAAVTQPTGAFLIFWALGVAALAARPRPPRPLVLAVIAVNALWVVESLLVLAMGWVQPNALGAVFVLAQATAVASFAGLQALALRAPRRAA